MTKSRSGGKRAAEAAKSQVVENSSVSRCDSLVEVFYKSPAKLLLLFGDGRWFDLAIVKIPIDAERIKWETAAASSNGASMLLVAVKGDEVAIAATTLRCIVDADFKREIDEELKRIRPTRKERLEMAKRMPPAPDWVFEPSPDMRRESWK